jgi:hypothetical protein
LKLYLQAFPVIYKNDKKFRKNFSNFFSLKLCKTTSVTSFIITEIDVSFIQKKSHFLRRVSEFGSQKPSFLAKNTIFQTKLSFFEKILIFEKKKFLLNDAQ